MDNDIIKRLEDQLAAATAATAAAEATTTAAEAATTAAQTEAAYWRERIEVLISTSDAAMAAAAALAAAVEAERHRWQGRFEQLLADTLRRVQANLQHINQNDGEETSGH